MKPKINFFDRPEIQAIIVIIIVFYLCSLFD
jgi:hypothetical protein